MKVIINLVLILCKSETCTFLHKNQISFGQVINNEIYDLSDESDNIISFLQEPHLQCRG